MSTESLDLLEHREKEILWVSGYYREQGTKPGAFYELLIRAFFQADRDNKLRLMRAFPVTAAAYKNYMDGTLKEKYELED